VKVAVAFDHAGVILREQLFGVIAEAGHEIIDLGTDSTAPVDYPSKALAVGRVVVIGSEVAAEIVVAFLAAVVSDEDRHVRRRAAVLEIERTHGG
jgi:ribose 5-phosphate isomerase B